MKDIKFTYTGLIGKNHGIDGTYAAVEGEVFKCENVLDKKIAAIWVDNGFAEYVAEEKKPAVKKEDVVTIEKSDDDSEEIEHHAEEKKPSKRGRKPKAK